MLERDVMLDYVRQEIKSTGESYWIVNYPVQLTITVRDLRFIAKRRNHKGEK